MEKEIEVSFPGDLQVEAKIREFVILTDQTKESGGNDGGPSPFEVFASSIATCTGFFALQFCQTRNIAIDGMHLKLRFEKNEKLQRYPKMSIDLHLPDNFPDKYRGAILKAMNQCAVKQHILQPPEFEIKAL